MSSFLISRLSRRSLLRALLLLSAGLLFALCVGPVWAGKGPAFGPIGPELALSNGFGDITSLVVGDDLWVRAEGVPALTQFDLILVDDLGKEVVGVGVESNTQGRIDATLLWFRSGVVGCDKTIGVDPLAHRYLDFDQAEVNLEARTFQVKLYDLGGSLVQDAAVLLRVNTDPRYFFADLTGCARSIFYSHESIYLSARNAAPGLQETAIYFVDQTNPVSSLGIIQEVRPQYQIFPQVLSVEQGTGDWTVLIWSGSESEAGDYGGLIHHFTGNAGYNYQVEMYPLGPFDNGPKRGPHGITIQTWGCPGGDDGCEY